MRRHLTSSGARGRWAGLATFLAIACLGAGCARDQEPGAEEMLGQDTALARNLAMANMPGAEGLSEKELAALVASQPPLPSWLAVAAQLDRNPPRPARAPAVSSERSRPPATPVPAQDQDRSDPRDTARELRMPGDTAVGRIIAGSVSPETSATVSRELSAGPASASPRAPISRTACESPALEDQRACLVAMLAEHDAPVNSAYRTRIDRLRREAGAGPGDPDPPSVRALREVQIRWLVFRDRECRRRTAASPETLWAPPRADCLGLFSTARAWELSQG